LYRIVQDLKLSGMRKGVDGDTTVRMALRRGGRIDVGVRFQPSAEATQTA
jgi:hypothetical protein